MGGGAPAGAAPGPAPAGSRLRRRARGCPVPLSARRASPRRAARRSRARASPPGSVPPRGFFPACPIAPTWQVRGQGGKPPPGSRRRAERPSGTPAPRPAPPPGRSGAAAPKELSAPAEGRWGNAPRVPHLLPRRRPVAAGPGEGRAGGERAAPKGLTGGTWAVTRHWADYVQQTKSVCLRASPSLHRVRLHRAPPAPPPARPGPAWSGAESPRQPARSRLCATLGARIIPTVPGMEDAGVQRGIWDGDAKTVQQCLTDIFTSVYTTCDIPENAIFGPCVLSHTSLYDSIAFIALKSTDKRTVPYIFRVDTSAANGSSEGLMWLRLVQSAREREEQNLEAYIKSGQLFYRSLRRIAKDEELLVWYGKELTELLLLGPARAPARTNGSPPFACPECSQRFQFELPFAAHLRFRCPKRLHGPDIGPAAEAAAAKDGAGKEQEPGKFGKPGGPPHHPFPGPDGGPAASTKPSTDFHNLARELENSRGGRAGSPGRPPCPDGAAAPARLYAAEALAAKLPGGGEAAGGGGGGGGLPKQSPFLYTTAFWPKSSAAAAVAAAAAGPLQLQLPSALTLLPPSFTSLCLPAQNWCAKCNASFRMTSDLVYHMRSHHKKEYALEPLVKRRREEKLKCPICNESFRERHHLSRHMTSHN
ncbi:PR domain zinc finger protein 8 [Passer montanus]|uniref:PR domain zinc finger protein 8 n=1 Tax=Passer montanus TaxID=9160 RepID=UPI0019619A34|nr:PR domain zinc finger protein 8 [Passer montanus]